MYKTLSCKDNGVKTAVPEAVFLCTTEIKLVLFQNRLL